MEKDENTLEGNGFQNNVDYDLDEDLTTRSPGNRISISLQLQWDDGDSRIKGYTDQSKLMIIYVVSSHHLQIKYKSTCTPLDYTMLIDVFRPLTFRQHIR